MQTKHNNTGVTTTSQLLLVCLVYIAFSTFSTPAAGPVADLADFDSSNLPIVVINTFGQTIVDRNRVVVHLGVINNGDGQRNYLTDPFNDYDGSIAIELRGSSSSRYPKQQYRFETQDSLGNNLNVSLLDLPVENDWVLYGPYDDQSLIRNVIAYGLSNDIGRYASRIRFCELVLNDEYCGLYVLMEKIKRDKDRIDISRMDSNDTAGDSLTGGYIIKIDKWAGENVGGWTSARGIRYQYHYPKPDDIVPTQQHYIQSLMDEFEMMMTGSDIADPSNGYPKYIDVESFVDHFILNEFCKNVDAYRLSTFMYKDRDNNGGKLVAGPIWDFNLSLGKAWYAQDLYRVEGWEVDHNQNRPGDQPKVPFWWENLGHDPIFASRAEARWHELRSGVLHKDSLFGRIDNLVDTLAEARERNFERWPESGSVNTYPQEIQHLKEWISDRIDWIDINIGQLTSAESRTSTEAFPKSFTLEQNYPNPFNGATRIGFVLPRASRVKISIHNVKGLEVLELLNSRKPAGDHSVEFDATDLPSGVYVYKIEWDGAITARKMTLVR